MSDSTSRLPARPSLEQLRKQAKDLLKAFRAADTTAVARVQTVLPRLSDPADFALADAQFVLAREYGFDDWAGLARHVDTINPPGLHRLEALAEDVATAYTSGNLDAIREINWANGTAFVWERDVTLMQQRLPAWFASEQRTRELAVADARHLVARQSGFDDWPALVKSLATSASSRTRAATADSSSFYRINDEQNTLEMTGPLAEPHWDVVIEVLEERGITGLAARGVTDAALERLSRVSGLRRLLIGGSGQLTDRGLRHLSRLPDLEVLDLGGPRSAVTDRGLEVLRDLRALRQFEMTWAPLISDTGIAHLAACDRLERVNLMGTPTGDGAVAALTGKRNLARVSTGRLVTDRGLALFHQFPMFKTWHEGETRYDLMTFEAQPTNLLLDGPFTDKGLAALGGLEGLFGLNLFWHTTGFTADGLRSLASLPNLGFLGCDGKRCNDDAMQHIAGIPNLRMLMAQGTVATNAGFEALSRSKTIEYIWGRECPNLQGLGFAALSHLPALRGLAVSCKYVDDEALATLPRFPALKALLPMDVNDAGFRHVGQCEQLEALCCMYCRDTTDVATGHIAGLSNLKTYYAGMTQITNRSLEILAQMPSIERLELWSIAGVTDSGVAALVALPRLRDIIISGSPRVTRAVLGMFPATVRVKYEG